MYFTFASEHSKSVVAATMADLEKHVGNPDDEAILGPAAREFARDARLHGERYRPYGSLAAGLLKNILSPVIIDAGTGSGEVALAVAAALPHAMVTGLDLSADMLAEAEHNRIQRGVTNVTFVPADMRLVSQMGLADLVVSRHAIHRVEEMHGVIQQLLLGVRSGGWLLVSGFRRAEDLPVSGQEKMIQAMLARADLPALQEAFEKAHMNAPSLRNYQEVALQTAHEDRGNVCCYRIREGKYNNVHMLFHKKSLGVVQNK